MTSGDTVVQLYVDPVDLWERAAIDGTLIDDIIGDDPVAFAEDFDEAHGGRRWIDKERKRLRDAIAATKHGDRP